MALARALAIEPRVLLLDEPLSALDAKVRVQLREEIRRIQSRLGITTIYVTHDQEESLSISDRVAVLSQGHIEQIGPQGEIYDAPATPFVAEFVGTMNRLEGTVEGDGVVAYGEKRLSISSSRQAARRARDGARAPRDGRAPAGERRRHGRPHRRDRLAYVPGREHAAEDHRGCERADGRRTGLARERLSGGVGMKVQARFPGETARVLTLEEPAGSSSDGQ